MARRSGGRGRKIRYAVVGLGYISQAAVLPAFANARRNSRLTALVSDDPEKRDELSKRYGVDRVYDYDQYDECLVSGEVDAVYIALPNHMHRDYAVRAAEAGKHILCEKPLAVTEEECEDMIQAAERWGVRLMTAYRLHFDRANLEAIEIVRSGELGEARVFDSVFTMQVKDEDNIRLFPPEKGGGPVYDIGIYCINAARYLFRAEPSEVFAWTASVGDERFAQTPEIASAILRFPVERIASFTCSFNGADAGWYQIVGTTGELRVDPAYEYAAPRKHQLTVGKTSRKTFPKRDQFAPELLYFSDCILKDRQPEPSGREGLADIRIIRAIHESARTGRPVTLPDFERRHRPTLEMARDEPPIEMPELVNAESPGGE